MGVRGLTSYVNSLPTGKGAVWETYELHHTPLVIDGNGLWYHLHCTNQLNCRYGGQYGQLEYRMKECFKKLSSHGVVPYVVFDGILDDSGKKLETTKKRRAERIKKAHNLWRSNSKGCDRNTMILPRLSQLVVVKVLQELGVQYAVADCEGDQDIASLANALNGPVMGGDSDYFIFNISQGYIPFDQYDFSGPSVTVKRFCVEGLAKHLHISSSMLPLLASLVGNDYVSDHILGPLKTKLSISSYQQSRGPIPSLAAYLSGYKSIHDAIAVVTELSEENSKFKEALALSIEEYQLKETQLLGYFLHGRLCSNLKTYYGHEIPKWLLKLYRAGAFPNVCMSILCHRVAFLSEQVEDMDKQSAHQCSAEIRWKFFKTLLEYDQEDEDDENAGERIVVTEFERKGLSLAQRQTDLETVNPETTFNILEIPSMSNESKVNLLLTFLSCNLTLVQHVPTHHQLVVAALRYWVIHATPPVTPIHLAALLVHYVGEKHLTSQNSYIKLEVDCVHGFAQWQNVLFWADYLSSLFSNVFPSLHPASLYDGVHVCRLYQKLKSCGIEAVKHLVANVKLYQQLYDVVLQDLPSHSTFIQASAKRKPKVVVKKSKETTPGGNSSTGLLKGNRFALLSVSAETDTDEDDG